MKKLLLATTVLASTNLFAISSNLTLTSDYVFRGVGQGSPAIQGSIGHSFDSGFSLLGWASNTSTGQELDLSVGYSHEIIRGITGHANIIWYDYTKTPGINYMEYNVGLTYGSYNFEIFHCPKMLGIKKNQQTYLELNGTQEVAKAVSLSALVGYTMIDKEELANQKDGMINYQAGVIHATNMMDLGMFYSDTNREDNSGEKKHDQSVFFKATKNF